MIKLEPRRGDVTAGEEPRLVRSPFFHSPGFFDRFLNDFPVFVCRLAVCVDYKPLGQVISRPGSWGATGFLRGESNKVFYVQ